MSDEEKKTISIEEKADAIKSSASLDSIPTMYLPDVFSNEYFFISYSHLDYRNVYIDLLNLQSAGFRFWYDRAMAAGTDWEVVARRNIIPFGCKGVLFYISENSLQSEPLIKELRFAMDCLKPVILVMMPFENDNYVDKNGEKIKGKIFDIGTMFDLLDHNGVNIKNFKNLKQELEELFPSEVIYLPYDMDASKKAEQITNKIKEIPVIKTSLDGGYPDYTLNVEKCNDDSVTELTIDRNIVGKAFDDVNAIVFKDSSFSNSALLKTLNVKSDLINCNRLSVESFAFYNCTNLTEVNVCSPELEYITLSNSSFKNCKSLTTFYRSEDGVINACRLDGDGIFFNCSSLKTINLRKTSRIGNSTFSGCMFLEEVTGLEDVDSVGDDAFNGCMSLTKLDFPKLKEIGDRAFCSCLKLKDVCLHPTLEYVGKNAFVGTSIKDGFTENHVKYWSLDDESGFIEVAIGVDDKTKESYKLDKYFTVIAGGAFEGCKNLKSIKLPPSLKSIGPDAFKDCSSLTVIRIPRSVNVSVMELFLTALRSKKCIYTILAKE